MIQRFRLNQSRVFNVFIILVLSAGALLYGVIAALGGIRALGASCNFRAPISLIVALCAVSLCIFFAARCRIRFIKSFVPDRISLVGVLPASIVVTAIIAFITLAWFGASTTDILWFAPVIFLKIIFAYVFYIFFALAIVSIGRVISRLLMRPSDFFSDLVIPFGLGLSFVLWYFYALSLVGIVSSATVAIFFVGSLIIMIRELPYFRSLLLNYGSLLQKPYTLVQVFVVLAALVSFAVIFNSVPLPFPAGADDLRAYFNIPMSVLSQGGLVEFPYNLWNNAPHLGVYAYIPIVAVSPYLLNFANIFFFIALLLVVALVAREIGGNRSSAWHAVLIFAALPMHSWFLTTAKIDYIVALFVMLSVYFFMQICKENVWQWACFGGYFLGVAVGVKYSAAYIIPGIVIAYLLYRGSAKLTVKCKLLLFFVAFALLASAPWAIRNIFVFGSPVYPLFPSVPATSSNEQVFSHDDNNRRYGHIHSSFVHGVSLAQPWYKNVASYAAGRSLYPGNAVGFVLFALVPLAAAAVVFPVQRMLLVVVAATLVIWHWLSLYQLWYVLYILAVLATVYATVSSRLRFGFRKLFVAIVLLAFVFTIDVSRMSMSRFFLPTYGAEDVIRLQGSEDLIQYVNDTLQAERPQYVLFGFVNAIYDRYIENNNAHLFVDDGSFGYSDIFVQSYDAEELLALLHGAGITHVYYVRSLDDFWRNHYCPYNDDGFCFESRIRENFDALKPSLRELYNNGDGVIYEVAYVS